MPVCVRVVPNPAGARRQRAGLLTYHYVNELPWGDSPHQDHNTRRHRTHGPIPETCLAHFGTPHLGGGEGCSTALEHHHACDTIPVLQTTTLSSNSRGGDAESTLATYHVDRGYVVFNTGASGCAASKAQFDIPIGDDPKAFGLLKTDRRKIIGSVAAPKHSR